MADLRCATQSDFHRKNWGQEGEGEQFSHQHTGRGSTSVLGAQISQDGCHTGSKRQYDWGQGSYGHGREELDQIEASSLNIMVSCRYIVLHQTALLIDLLLFSSLRSRLVVIGFPHSSLEATFTTES